MRRFFVSSLLLGLALLAGSARADVIPHPASVQESAGQLLLPAPVNLVPVTAELQQEQALLQDYLQQLDIGFTGARGELPGIGLAVDQQLQPAAYRLTLDATGVQIVGGDAAGVLYGIQTLRQLLAQAEHTVEGLRLKRQTIEDKPRFPYRGMHLDVSRHFFDVDFIKRYIDLLALHKMNVFHWHLTDDQGWRLQSKAYPRLTEVGSRRSGTVVGHTHDAGATSDAIPYGGFYSWEDVREVVEYAALHHIMVVPEIDVPGHASAMIAAYPELGCGAGTAKVQTHFGVFPEILCPSEYTFAFLETLFAEVVQLFPGPYIHIGGDEVRKDHWRDCVRCDELMQQHNLADYGELQAWFVNRSETIVHGLGKRIIGWDEILDGEVRPSATVMSWRGQEGGIRAARAGHDVIMTPLQHVYFDFYQGSSVDEPMAIHGLTRLRDVYAFQPVPEELTEPERSHILGAQANLWTEYVASGEDAERMVLPRMSALAEVLWTPADQQDFDRFTQNLSTFEALLTGIGYKLADSHYKPHIAASENADGSYTVSLDSLGKDMRYSLDGGPAQPYQGPFRVAGSARIRAHTVLGEGETIGDARLTVVDHLARGAEVRPAEPSGEWTAGKGTVLVDGLLATDRIFRYPEWHTFGPQGMDLVLYLEAPARLSQVSIGWQAGFHRQLFRPTSASVQVPGPEGVWITVAELDSQTIAASDGNRLLLEFAPVTAGRVRVTAQTEDTHWSEEQSREIPSTLRVDEIIVR